MDAQKAVNTMLYKTLLYRNLKILNIKNRTAAKWQPAVIGGTTWGQTATNDIKIELVRAVNNHLPKQQKSKQLLMKQEIEMLV